jgi:hypothetical protein
MMGLNSHITLAKYASVCSGGDLWSAALLGCSEIISWIFYLGWLVAIFFIIGAFFHKTKP